MSSGISLRPPSSTKTPKLECKRVEWIEVRLGEIAFLSRRDGFIRFSARKAAELGGLE